MIARHHMKEKGEADNILCQIQFDINNIYTCDFNIQQKIEDMHAVLFLLIIQKLIHERMQRVTTGMSVTAILQYSSIFQY